MSGRTIWTISFVLSEMCLFMRSSGALQYMENSSERFDQFDPFKSGEERWADAAYRLIHNLDCNDSADAFFTTKRECRELTAINRNAMNIYIAEQSMFGIKYKTFLPDEELSRSESHDAVLVVDPYPAANFGHLVVVFYIDNNVNPSDCYTRDGINIGK